MANTATLKTSVALKSDARFYAEQAVPFLIEYDTPGQVLTIAGSSNKSVYLVGLECVCSSSYILTFHSGATVLQTYPLSSNSGRIEPLCPANIKILCTTEPGEALGLSSNVALPPFVLYIVEV